MTNYEHARPKGMVSWDPIGTTRTILEQVAAVLRDYREHWPLTLRQIFYRLVARYDYEKSDNAYKRLGEYLVRARRSGMIGFDAMRDDGWTQTRLGTFESPESFKATVRYAAENFTLDKQAGQVRWLGILVEAAGMIPQIERVAGPYSVPVFSSGGFDSLTVKKELADMVEREGRRAIFLHIGDLDPSGVCIFDSVKADVEAFLTGGEVDFERLILTPDQVDRYDLPTAPAKRADKRGEGMEETCQAESLAPDELAGIVLEAIERHTDLAVFEDDCEREIEDRKALVAWVDEA